MLDSGRLTSGLDPPVRRFGFLPIENPYTYFQHSSLFKGVAEKEFKNFLKDCSFAEFRVGERVHFGARVSSDIPIFVVSEGCLPYMLLLSMANTNQ